MFALGENIARIRTARGLTQDGLAQASGVSVDTISRLERSVHTTARRSTLQALAMALCTDPGRLLGIMAPERDTLGAEQLRRAVRALDLPDFTEPVEVLALSELHAATSGAWSDYLAGRHTELLAGLPALMVDTRRAVGVLADDHAAEAAGLLATSYRIAAGLSGRLGLLDLAAHAAHRALDTARFTTRPELDEAGALRYLVWVLVRQGDLAGAERIAVHAAERLDAGLLARPDRDRIGVFGSLLMNAASAAARQGAPGRAEDLLRVASSAAARLGVDRTDETGMLGPRIVAMQAVDQAIDAEEPDRAIQLATQVPDATGPVAPFWESGHRLHLAAACADLERWGDVIEHLAAARALAPQWSRVQPLGHTVVGQLVEHRGRRSERISELAAHYGVGLIADGPGQALR